MLDTSTVSMKCMPSYVYNPRSVGLSLALSSRSQIGWVKAPVPTMVMPFSLHHRAMFSTSISRLVARLYFEWRWRSAMIRTDRRPGGMDFPTDPPRSRASPPDRPVRPKEQVGYGAAVDRAADAPPSQRASTP